jgi:hypothetical protein
LGHQQLSIRHSDCGVSHDSRLLLE